MPDFGDDEWPNMVCVEAANVLHHTVDLGAGNAHHVDARSISHHPETPPHVEVCHLAATTINGNLLSA